LTPRACSGAAFSAVGNYVGSLSVAFPCPAVAQRGIDIMFRMAGSSAAAAAVTEMLR